MEIDVVEGSNSLNEPLPRPSELVQQVRTTRKRANSQSPPLPPSFLPHWVRGDGIDTNVHVNQQLPPPPPPPSSYDACLIRGNNDGRGVHTIQQLSPPPSPYYASSIRGNDDDRDVHTYQQLTPPPSYRPLSLRGNDNDIEFARSYIDEIDFPILDRSDPSQLKFKPQLISDDETSGVDLTLNL
ncbi:hypothetical protein HAX54_046240 [Datura stramonium]|uniref:Uncharacterized protein n=1 Tax=Datura stramonium TaxID=4076 RepID=A0ABS8WKH5_DATST|nr:hypothetical protein [Datura stramonium]